MPIVNLSELATVATEYGRWQALNGPLRLTGFGVNAMVADIDERIDTGHDESESGQEELYIVVAGSAVITVDGVEHVARPGTLVSAPDPLVVRSIRPLESGTRIVCLGAPKGSGDEGYGDWIVPA
jgi:mannose-6-phosphate isomerase-like protein (cupin superfamily)